MERFSHRWIVLQARTKAWFLALACGASACDPSLPDQTLSSAPAPLAEAGNPPAPSPLPSNISDAASEPGAAPEAGGAATLGAAQASQQSPGADGSELVVHSKWVRVDPTLDPFSDRPPNVTCEPSATFPELFGGTSAFEVDTASCNYVTLQQPTTASIAAGEVVSVRLAHFALTAPEASSAHVAVRVEDLLILDEHIPIPSDSQVLVRKLTAPRALPAGAGVYFHVHNHGSNAYALISVARSP